ncbi:MAG: phosphoribosylanthranilate isomerase [Oscillochloridaceae bacterium umkhey_bin13]
MLIKICGLRMVEHALAAQAAGADLLGLVFAPSRRQISPADAALLVEAVRAAPGPQPLIVGLFVNTSPATIRLVADQVGLDALQLSGDEPVAAADHFDLPILKSVRLDGSAAEVAWLARSAPTLAAWPAAPLPLVDAHVPGQYGGSGVIADWDRAAILAAQQPIMLAGGLDPVNVAEAIAKVRPAGVDVSSGVETTGVKDGTKITAFIRAARAAAR